MKNKRFAIRMAASAVGLMMMAGICAGQSYWKRTYGGADYDRATAITPTPDGNFIVLGTTSSFGAGGYDVYLLKIKPDGDTLWTKTYGGTNDDGASAITPTPDGNFLVAGNTFSFGKGGQDIYLLKINSIGDTLWTKTYGGTENDGAYAITPTPDGNFLVAGYTESYGKGWEDIYLLKINSSGDTVWTKTYGGTLHDEAFVITQTLDGNFIVAGYTESFGKGYGEIYLLKINSSGDTLWTKTYGGSWDDGAYAITPTLDGNFIIAGYTYSFGAGGGDVYLLKITSSGDTLWTKTYGGTDRNLAYAITLTPEGNFIIAGETYSFGKGNNDVYLLKINTSGDTLWTKTYGGTSYDVAFAITPTSDGNFIIAGISEENVFLLSIINDRYAYKSIPFTFKIPVSGDSLNHGYTPLKIPSGMTVSLGGTISWTPTTDSSYMDHVEFLVSDDVGKKDTLTFNIFVNSKNNPSKVINPTSGLINQAHQSGISISTYSSFTSFSLPVPTGSLAIYNIHGRLIQNLSFKNNSAMWRGKIPAGRYFAKMTDGRRDVVKAFVVVR